MRGFYRELDVGDAQMPRIHSRVVVCGSPASFAGWRSIAHRYMCGCGEEVIFISERVWRGELAAGDRLA